MGKYKQFSSKGCGKLASFFHIALSSKKEVSLPHYKASNYPGQ
jgi:hypothetical protein